MYHLWILEDCNWNLEYTNNLEVILLGKKVQRLKEKHGQRKAIANGTYNKRGKAMVCIKCKDR